MKREDGLLLFVLGGCELGTEQMKAAWDALLHEGSEEAADLGGGLLADRVWGKGGWSPENAGEIAVGNDGRVLDFCDDAGPKLHENMEAYEKAFAAWKAKLHGSDASHEAISKLREEAANAGDVSQVDLCNRAISGDEVARAACIEAISAAKAMIV